MTEGQVAPRAGWYTTESRGQVRFWDGNDWTEHHQRVDGLPDARSGSTGSSRGVALWIGIVLVLGGMMNLSSEDGPGGALVAIVLGLIAGSVWYLARRNAKQREAAEAALPFQPVHISTTPDGNHLAPPPIGEALEPWGACRDQLEVVGESYHPDAFIALFGGRIPTDSNGGQINDVAAIVPDFDNPHDSHAVAVWVRGQHVGYFDRDTARRWAPLLAKVERAGGYLEVPVRVWAAVRQSGWKARVTVRLPRPDEIAPANQPPSEGVVLPRGAKIQVTKEEDHMDVLTKYTNGDTVTMAVTLHAIHEIRARSATETVEVRIDGERVGILSPTQSANLLPLVKFVEERGQTAVAHAGLRGNALKADVTLDTLKAQDVSEEWLASLGPKTVDLNRPTRATYEWDD
ncbi:HIRAN domain-containing protein [Demequina capsici]|uniref:HIRAN domain-containing protein n=1 Tax=Demequina capsici TaxID=3075620 RepID=A0AA96FEP5_9MICO|nr:HIRAN domain-containing protein [Demequina sp. PMTSA13]WNM28144.1 HIRAN domain-containing protein [Demequina sp. PMTSA13]